jgi:hypothetical protein
MPRHVITRREPPIDRQLVEELVAELRNPRELGQPLILEERLAGGLQVEVVWDRFADVSHQARASIIVDAYARAFGADHAKQIALALGMSGGEAASLGRLAYQIVPARSADDQPLTAKQREAMLRAGSAPNGDRPDLRFATMDDAGKALDVLRREDPDTQWIVIHEVFSPVE